MVEEKKSEAAGDHTQELKEDISAIVFDMTKYEAGQKSALEEARASQRDDFLKVCAALNEAGVAKVSVEYDGYGDSGMVEGIIFLGGMKDDEHITLTKEQDMSVPCKVERSRRYEKAEDAETGTWKIEYEEKGIEAFIEECVYKWLPGGWEINEGSRGVVMINVRDRSYGIEHGWRETIENYEEYSFEFDAKEEES